ncbi:ATP-binding protein [Ciceribacter sp. RN22]|uniref:sensor histidine kinase n=1 Tax=Ciceribacter sp. RN22 TaxID=2954932 RepID=UPI002093797B|nr:ATP-binding protein [Ciceribacter sp. RN22]MCO6180923.1 ATP-binding protein [Ciceribacter sp. RN22]
MLWTFSECESKRTKRRIKFAFIGAGLSCVPVRQTHVLAMLAIVFGICLSVAPPAYAATARLLSVEMLRVDDDTLTISDVAASQSWRPLPDGGLVGGFSSDTFWFRLRYVGPPQEQGVVFVLPTYLNDITLFVPDPHAGTRQAAVHADELVHYQQGDQQPLTDKVYRWRGFAAPIPFSGREGDIAYVRLRTRTTVLFWPRVDTQVGFSSYLLVESLIAGALALGLLLTVVVGVVRWRVHGDAISRSFATYAAAALFFLAARDGYLSLIPGVSPVLLNRSVGLSICLLVAANIAFYRTATQIRAVSRALDCASRLAVALAVGGAVVAAIGAYPTIARPLQFFGLIMSVGWAPLSVFLAHYRKSLHHSLLLSGGFLGTLAGYCVSFLLVTGDVNLSFSAFYSAEISLLASLVLNLAFAVCESMATAKEHRRTKTQLAMERMSAELNREAAETHHSWVKIFSHQIKTPLAVIKVSSQNIERLVPQPDILERTRKISSNAGKIDELVHSLLHVEDIRARLNERRHYPFDALELARSSLPTGAGTIDVVGERGITARGAADVLRIALSKLIDNALIHSGVPTSVRVSVERKDCDGRRAVVLHVLDAGPQISNEVQANMFARHWRGRDSKGHGVGLWAAALIAEAHGGQVRYERTSFEENQFSIWLPE